MSANAKDKKAKAKENEAIGELLKLVNKAVKSSNVRPIDANVRDVTVSIPCKLRLGEAIVGALAHVARKNNVVNEDIVTALTHISDEDLGDAIVNAHKPYGFN